MTSQDKFHGDGKIELLDVCVVLRLRLECECIVSPNMHQPTHREDD